MDAQEAPFGQGLASQGFLPSSEDDAPLWGASLTAGQKNIFESFRRKNPK